MTANIILMINSVINGYFQQLYFQV